MKTKLLFTFLLVTALGYAQVQPIVHNDAFDKIELNIYKADYAKIRKEQVW